MSTWFEEYGRDHQNLTNRKIHRVCVPLIFISVVATIHLLGWAGDVLLALSLIWYGILGLRSFAIMTLQEGIAVALAEVLLHFCGNNAFFVFASVFFLGWCGQFYGHILEGRRPSFLKDLQYLLIGPLWIWLGH